MSKEVGILVNQPKSIWKKPVKVDFKSLFKILSKSVAQGAFNNWGAATANAIDMLSCFSLENKPEDKAWRLIYSSTVHSMFDIVNENKELFRNQITQSELLKEDIEKAINGCEFIIDNNFFYNPTSINVFIELKNIFKKWLKSFDLGEAQIESISNRLDSYFVFALNNEWCKNLDDYKEVYEILNSPFSEKVKKETEWLKYTAMLQKQIDEPLFLEAFSLRQAYIPLNAYYQVESEEDSDFDTINGQHIKKDIKNVVDLECELSQWLKSEEQDDNIKIICGGPGSGKSSFVKIFASQQTQNSAVRILYIPLQHFSMESDLIKAVGKFMKYDGFISYNPLEQLDNESRLLLIFDGLDEIELQGKAGSEAAQIFIRAVKEELINLNRRICKVRVLITSRNVAVQLNQNELRKEKQIYNILEYYISNKRDERSSYKQNKKNGIYFKDDFKDPLNLLDEDKRQTWWTKYGRISGNGYKSMPTELNNDKLMEITSQPLLNYLVALSYERKKINFKTENNINKIYEDLLESIYNREWENDVHNSIKNVEYDKFVRVLEEISIAAWHGNGRTTTVKEIESYCGSSNLSGTIKEFQKGASCGVTRLLLAFYFRRSGSSPDGEDTFEFTHKSFGEYLVAKRLIRTIKIINKNIEYKEADSDYGWSYRTALQSWFQMCGLSNIDEYLLDFINNEIMLCEKVDVVKWQKVFINLLNYTFKSGIPFDSISPRPSFIEEIRQSRNAEEGLFIILNSFTSITKELYNLSFPTPTYLGEWIKRLQGQRTDAKNPLFFECINYMSIKLNYLHGQDFHGIKLSNTKAIGIRATSADFGNCNFSNVNL